MLLENSGNTSLSYTVTNDRGWNDPPVHIFSPLSVNRKKTNLNRRVAHNITANGYSSPQLPPHNVNQNFSDLNTQMNHVSENFQQMSLAHSNSNPNLHQINTLPQQLNHAASMPYNMSQLSNSISPISGHVSGYITPPQRTCTPPLASIASLTPPSPNNRRVSEPCIPPQLNAGVASIFNNHVTPTMLQSSHLDKKEHSLPLKTNDHVTYNQAESFQPVSAPMSPYDYYNNISQEGPASLPPAAAHQLDTQQVVFARSNSAPGLRKSPTGAHMGPPPTSGFYTKSNVDSPSLKQSPISGRSKSPLATSDVKLENNNELLEKTVENLQNCKEKCICVMNSKTSDDINKRIKNLHKCWSEGKLSANVKLQISQLAAALQCMDISKANKVHKTLIVEYSNEVMPWIVGIKKLIVTSQQAIVENNQYES